MLPVAKDGILSKDDGESCPDFQMALEAVAQGQNIKIAVI